MWCKENDPTGLSLERGVIIKIRASFPTLGGGGLRHFSKPTGKALAVSFIGIVLNIVAAQIRISFYWVLLLLVLALIISILTEGVGKMDTRGKQVSFNVEPPTGWRQVIVWALVYTLIGAAIAVIALSLPLSHRELYHQLFGGLNDIDLNYYWYDVVSVAAITALSFLIGLRRRSVAKLILFALFSSLGTAMIVGSLERYGAPVYTTYLIVFTIALLVGVLMFYRSMIFDLLRETWGSHPVENSTQAKTELKEQPKPAEDIKDIITESSTVSDGSS